MKKIILFLILSGANLLFASSFKDSFPFKESKCKFGSLYLRFDKKIEDSSGFSEAPLIFLKGKSHHAIKPVAENNEYSFAKVTDDSPCTDTQAYRLDNNTYAILISQDNRPFHDIYFAIIYDSKKDKVLEIKNLNSVVESFKIKNGFAFATVIPRSDTDAINLTSNTGKTLPAYDSDLEAFQSVTMKNGTLVIGYDPDLSFEKSKWKKYFKNKADYLKAAGWNEKTKSMKNVVVYFGEYFSRKESDILDTCIALTDKRGGEWESQTKRCLQEKQ